MVFGKDKIIGTFAPVFSLQSNQQSPSDQGTFATGIHFIDWLKRTHQHAWQILPLSETQLEKGSANRHVPSPYKGYGIGLDPQYLSSEYKKLIPTNAQMKSFLKKHQAWIYDYAYFCAFRDHFGTDDWRVWSVGLRDRHPQAIKLWKEKLAHEIAFYLVQQWQLHTSYNEMHKHAKKKNILIIGDLPFYVSLKSPLVWANRDLFEIDKKGQWEFVSGAATLSTSHFGRQVWWHPLYNWSKKEKLLTFWKMRLEYRSHLYDVIRFDYAIGFLAYAAKHVSDASKDEIRNGPGEEFIDELVTFTKSKGLDVFFEDSGNPIKILREYMQHAGIPGIRIFRFAYDELIKRIVPHYAEVKNYPPLSVAYATTHDTEPLLGYLEILTQDEKVLLATHAHIAYNKDDRVFAASIRKALLTSPAKTVILQLQDWLLTTERINIPGTEKEVNDTNWNYKLHIPIEDLPSKV